MIIKSDQLAGINGGLPPFMSVINTDFLFTRGAADGVYFQQLDGENTLVFSIRGATATICRLGEQADTAELCSFLHIQGIKNVLSDFLFDGICFEERALLKATPMHYECADAVFVTPSSRLGDYKAIFNLLSGDGSFDIWYSLFSAKVNNGFSYGACIMADNQSVSCAVAPFVFDNTAVVAGVFTHNNYRQKGYATRCVKALLSQLHSQGVAQAYLWCENKNIKLYENIGFSLCGKIYVKKEE